MSFFRRSTIVAANVAQYGSSPAVEYADIRAAERLACRNQTLLVGYLQGGLENDDLRSFGFEGGAVGNHAQLLYMSDRATVLPDSTTGMIAQTSFDDLLRGVPIPERNMRVFAIADRKIESFRKKVFSALRDGKYRPSDFMYMQEDRLEQKLKGRSGSYFTPGGIAVRARLSKP